MQNLHTFLRRKNFPRPPGPPSDPARPHVFFVGAALLKPRSRGQVRDHIDPNYYDDHFGLVRRDFSEKPSYQMFKQLLAG